MPIYGYVCKKCDHAFQTLVQSGETPACPACASKKLEQQLSLIAAPTKSSPAAAPMCEGGFGSCGMCGGGGGCD